MKLEGAVLVHTGFICGKIINLILKKLWTRQELFQFRTEIYLVLKKYVVQLAKIIT